MFSWRGEGQFFATFLIKVVGPEYHLNNENRRILPEMQQAANESAYYAVTYFMQENTHNKTTKYSL
jgi:hypothetical protein